jgi:arylsulfatase A-like enzyme
MMSNKFFIYCFLTFGVFFTASLSVNANPKKNPNIIYIYASDLGKGLLSAYGQKHFTTPNIDALINNGVSFSNAYGGSLSAFARASQLTGYHDCNKGLWRISNGGAYIKEDTAHIYESEFLLNSRSVFLPENDLYLPQVFRNAGYVTGQIGKLGIGNISTRQQVERYGWDYFYGFLDLVRSEGYYPPFLFENDQTVIIEGNTRRDGGISFSPESELAYQARWNMEGKKAYAPDLFLKKIIECLHEFKDSPFFLMYSTPFPRGPVSVPVVHPEVANNDALAPIEKEYASMVKLLDDQVGIILKELQSLNLNKNTIIVFASDNGHDIHYHQQGRLARPFSNQRTGELFDNDRNKYRSADAGDIFNGNAGMAGLKYSNLNGGINTPLVFSWEGKIKKRVCEEVVAGYDFLPTIADLVGVKLNTKKDGVSFLPALMKGKKLSKNRYVIVGSEEGPVMITNEGWKLRYNKVREIYELYNLKRDPEEKYDVKLRFPEIVEKMQKTLLEECDGNIANGILY